MRLQLPHGDLLPVHHATREGEALTLDYFYVKCYLHVYHDPNPIITPVSSKAPITSLVGACTKGAGTLPYPTLPYPILPYPTLPYHFVVNR